jgi:GT2 family glycosyltransferase
MRPKFKNIALDYLFEKRQGKSFALNSGFRRATADLISGVDDDVEIAKDWYIETEKLFRERPEIEFAGGKILPNLESDEIPSWIEPLKKGVLGWRDYGEEEWNYNEATPMLTGAHAIFRRNVFDDVGFFSEELGPKGKNLIGLEDGAFYEKLLRAGKRGVYSPRLVVFHFMPKYRMSKNYFRHWCFGAGISMILSEAQFETAEVVKFFGVPRYLYREAIRNLLQRIKNGLSGKEAEALENEKAILVFAGAFYGKNLRGGFLSRSLGFVGSRLFGKVER